MNAVLIDDEAVIIQGLKKLVDWEQLGIQIVGEAIDGREGLKLIEEKMPDLVISDVTMPNLSGIDMLKNLNMQGINVKMIFLSGYQDFFYARDAMRYGATDYLLKPVSPGDLTEVVRRAMQQIREERSFHMLRKKDSQAELLFQDILSQKEKYENLGHFLHTFNSDTLVSGAVCIAMRIVVGNRFYEKENKNLARFEVYEFIRQYLEESGTGILVRKEYNVCYFIIFATHDREWIQKYCISFSNQIYSQYQVDCIVGCGAWSDLEGKMSYLYKTARFALELYYFTVSRYTDYETVEKEYDHSLEEYQEHLKQLKEQIITNYHSNEILPLITECVSLLGNIHYGNKNVVINNCILLSGEIFTSLKECGLVDENSVQEQGEFLEEVCKKPTLQQLQALFEDYYGRIFLKIRLLGKNRESMDVARIKQYIKKHFKENITLEEIADFIGMNPSYMSVFFKKETGQNFKAYVTEVRMKEALKLINSTDMKDYKLAESVGYRDAKQFRENFKDIYGVSPQQYRKRGGI